VSIERSTIFINTYLIIMSWQMASLRWGESAARKCKTFVLGKPKWEHTILEIQRFYFSGLSPFVCNAIMNSTNCQLPFCLSLSQLNCSLLIPIYEIPNQLELWELSFDGKYANQTVRFVSELEGALMGFTIALSFSSSIGLLRFTRHLITWKNNWLLWL